jgi:PBP1b-binding outer membrane lipoprotein LpoB
MKNIFFVTILFTLGILGGCGYKVGFMTLGAVKTIAIGTVVNQTNKPFIQDSTVSRTLVEQFHRDGSLKIVSADIADAEIFVTLVGFNQNAQAFSQQGITQNLRMHVDADVLVKKKSGEILYHANVQGQADYNVQLDQTEIERVAVKAAIQDLCIDIVRNVVEGGGW